MTTIESAWESHPGYRIDIVPFRGTACVVPRKPATGRKHLAPSG